jgi:hypothetical protein
VVTFHEKVISSGRSESESASSIVEKRRPNLKSGERNLSIIDDQANQCNQAALSQPTFRIHAVASDQQIRNRLQSSIHQNTARARPRMAENGIQAIHLRRPAISLLIVRAVQSS